MGNLSPQIPMNESQNPLACPITNFNVIGKVLNGSISILTNELLKLGYCVGHCGADRPVCWSSGCPTGPEPSMPSKHPCTTHAFFLDACLIIARVSVTLFPIFAQHFMHTVPLSDPSQNHIRPDTELQIKGRKKSVSPLSCVKFCTLAPKLR
jgi:hypothetical protein